jgi:beta-glucosidase
MKTTRLAFQILILSLFLFALVTTPISDSSTAPNVEARVNALLAKMTLAEKLGQLQQLDGEGTGDFRPEHVDLIRKGLLGSTLNVRGAKKTNQLQRIAVEESRLKIPNLFGYDVIHGYRTIFPIPLAEASSWDPALAEANCKYCGGGNICIRCSLDLCSHGRHRA